jgi:hypothetical protein
MPGNNASPGLLRSPTEVPSTGMSTAARRRASLTWGFATGKPVDVYRLRSIRAANWMATAAPMLSCTLRSVVGGRCGAGGRRRQCGRCRRGAIDGVRVRCSGRGRCTRRHRSGHCVARCRTSASIGTSGHQPEDHASPSCGVAQPG